jgi:hypothetical protein
MKGGWEIEIKKKKGGELKKKVGRGLNKLTK